jgi:hypothetical protein
MIYKHIKVKAETHKMFEACKLEFSPAEKRLTQDEFLGLLLEMYAIVKEGVSE